MRPLDRVGPINHPLLCGNSYSDGKLNLATARSVHCGQSYSWAVRIPAWDGWMDMDGYGRKPQTRILCLCPIKSTVCF